MKLSVYLMRDTVTDFSQVIIERYKQGENPFTEVTPSAQFEFEYTAFIQALKTKEPKWISFLNSGFNLSETSMVNTSNSFVLLIKRAGRLFAFTFGYGYSAVDKALVESGFGLRVTLNSIGASDLDTIDTRNIDLVTRQTRTHISLASPIYEFGINTTMDWIRYASGKPSDDSPISRFSGSDSLQASFEEVNFSQLGDICDVLLERWESDDYKARFPFIDYLRRIPKEDALVARLSGELKRRINERSTDRVSLAHPEIPNQEIDTYKMWVGRKSRKVSELDIAELYSFLDELREDSALASLGIDDITILGLDMDDNPKTQKRSILDYIVCEIELEEKRYIHSLNEWFLVANDYMDEIRMQIQELEIRGDRLNFPPIRRGETEGDYNHRVAMMSDYLLLDRHTFQFDGYHNRIEACDLATRQGDLIAIKKMTASATLSHLFAQGSVSAKLLKLDSRYQGVLEGTLRGKWADYDIPTERIRFIFAIPSTKTGNLSETLFFFSMVNLVEHVETIRLAGFRVGICKIGYE